MALGPRPGSGRLAFDGVTATGWVADFLAQLEGRGRVRRAAAAGRLPRHTAALSGCAATPGWRSSAVGPGRLPGRRHGPGQDDPDAGPAPARLGASAPAARRCSICPTSVVGNWKKEAERFTPDLPVLVHHGAERDQAAARFQEAAAARPGALQLSLLHRDLELFKKVDWAGVVLDEAQNIKNPETKQAQGGPRLCRPATASP